MKIITLCLLCIFTYSVYATSPTAYDQQYVQWKNQQPTSTVSTSQSKVSSSRGANISKSKVSINQANLQELQQLIGVGEKKRKRLLNIAKHMVHLNSLQSLKM